MKWTKLTIDTTCEAEDLISAFLEEEGVLGVQIEDNIPLTEEEMETMFVDLLPDDMPENDGAVCRWYLYVQEESPGNTEHPTS